jgi:hypothetical protein
LVLTTAGQLLSLSLDEFTTLRPAPGMAGVRAIQDLPKRAPDGSFQDSMVPPAAGVTRPSEPNISARRPFLALDDRGTVWLESAGGSFSRAPNAPRLQLLTRCQSFLIGVAVSDESLPPALHIRRGDDWSPLEVTLPEGCRGTPEWLQGLGSSLWLGHPDTGLFVSTDGGSQFRAVPFTHGASALATYVGESGPEALVAVQQSLDHPILLRVALGDPVEGDISVQRVASLERPSTFDDADDEFEIESIAYDPILDELWVGGAFGLLELRKRSV